MAAALALAVLVARPAAAQTPAEPDRRAFLVGFKHYPQSRVFTTLPYATEDLARMVSALLGRGYSAAHITVVSDVSHEVQRALADDPRAADVAFARFTTIGRLTGDMSQFMDDARLADAVLLYLSGHGAVLGDYRFLALPDSEPSEAWSMLPVVEVLNKLGALQHPKKLLVVDTCANEVRQARVSLDYPSPERTRVNELLSSRLSTPSYWDDRLRSSVFTHFFVSALERADAPPSDGLITVDEVASYLTRWVPEHKLSRLMTSDPYAPPELVVVSEHRQVPSKVIVDSFVVSAVPNGGKP